MNNNDKLVICPEDPDQRHLHRQAWALFGQLVLRGVIPIPNFDLSPRPELYKTAGDHLHEVIMDLMLSLQRIDQQPTD